MAGFGEKIRTLRKAKGLTLDQLAEMTESSKSYVWELENKNPPRPSAEKIGKMAKALGVTGDYLMGEEVPLADATDEAFFRKYRDLSPEVKDRMRKMMDLLDD